MRIQTDNGKYTMNMKNRLIYSFLSLVGAGMLAASVASAHGFGPGMDGSPADLAARFQSEASLLGVTVDEIKAAWAQGKTIADVATAHAITKEQLAEKMKAQKATNMKTRLQALVTAGVITQAQADQRLLFMQAQKAKPDGKGKGMGIGFGRGGRFGGHGGR